MSDTRIGIDLGTCFSSVAFEGPNGIHYLKDPHATQLSYSIPSSALLRADGEIVFGGRAEVEKGTRPDCYQREFKRDLGSETPYQLRDRNVTAADLTSLFVKYLAGAAQQATGRTPVGGVITVPVAYDATRRGLITAAAHRAGLREIKLVDEPVAAVVAAAAQGEIPAEGTTLVYDLGGGTFDTALVRMQGGRLAVLAAKGLADFGGTDIDIMIEQDFAATVGPEFSATLAGLRSEDPTVRAKAQRAKYGAREFCRLMKHNLSNVDSATDDLFMVFTYELTRPRLEAMVRPHLERTIAACHEVLAVAGVSSEKVDNVLLVGGASRMPLVEQLVATKLGRPVRRTSDPELVVCHGAGLLTRVKPKPAPAPAPVEPVPAKKAEPAKPAVPTKPPAPAKPVTPARPVVTAKPHVPYVENRLMALRARLAGLDGAQPLQKLIETAATNELANAKPVPVDRAWVNATIPKILTEHRAGTNFHVGTIPAAMLANARATTMMPAGEKALGLIDCTFWGSAKDAIIFGEDAVYQAHPKLPGATYRPIQRVTYPELREKLKVPFRLDGSNVTVATFQKVIDAIRVELAKPAPVVGGLAVAYSSTGERVVVGLRKDVGIWWSALMTRDPVVTLPHGKAVNAVDTFGGWKIATGCDDGSARLWDTSAAPPRQVWAHASGKAVCGVKFSPDGARLAIACLGGAAKVLDCATGKVVMEVMHNDDARCVAFDPTGTFLATGSTDGSVRVWDWARAAQTAAFIYDMKVFTLDFSPNGKSLATGTSAGRVEIWDFKTQTSTGTIEVGGFLRSLKFSPDGAMIATATKEGVVDVWQVATQAKLFTTTGLADVWGVTWRPDGTVLATTSDNGTQIWSLGHHLDG